MAGSSREDWSQEGPTVLAVVLHYGSAADTWACVETIAGLGELDIVVADNDPSQTLRVPSMFQGRVGLFRTGGGAGFAEANNAAVRFGRASAHRAVLLLNNDTLVCPGAVSRLRAVLSLPEVGAVGPCMPSSPDSNSPVWACGGVVDKLRIGIHGVQPPADGLPCEVDYLPGAAILCKLSAWDKVGGLPERYFLTYEEAEFALRMKDQGYRIVVAPSAIVLHTGRMSSDRQPMYIYNTIRSRIRFSEYLWRRVPGFLWGCIVTLAQARQWQHGYALWAQAVIDEARGDSLSNAALQRIRERYSR